MPAVRGDEDAPVPIRRGCVHLVVRLEAPDALAGLRVDRVHAVVPGADVEAVAVKQRGGLERRALVAPALTPGLGIPRHDEAIRSRLSLRADHAVHVGLVDESLADRGRRGGAAAEALAPGDSPGLGVQREEEALLLGDVDAPVAHAGRELDRVVRVDRPQALVGRAVVVRGDVRALVVVPVGRPGPRVVLLRRRLLLLLGGHELLRGGAALLYRVILAADIQTDRDREDDHDKPASQQQASSSHGAQDGRRIRCFRRQTACARCALSLSAARD